MRDVDNIVALYFERERAKGPILRRMQEVRDLSNGDVIIPLNELDSSARSTVANLLVQGLDQTSMRVASVMPAPWFPPLAEGQKRSTERARQRKQAMLAWWDANRMPQKLRRRARHLLGYSESPVAVLPDFKKQGCVKWNVRNPLDTFAAPRDDPDDPVPADAIFRYRKPLSWLIRNHPSAMIGLTTKNDTPDTLYTLLHYIDDEQITMIVCGKAQDVYGSQSKPAYRLLDRVPNKAGVPLVSVPLRITLDEQQGQFDSMVGMHYTRARLDALTAIAIERDIFPEEWLVARPGEMPEIITQADGRLGQLGVVRGGTIERMTIAPGYKTTEMLDRLERQERLEGAIPAEFGGESASNIRTGRRGDAVLSATVDFRVQEAQATFEVALRAEDGMAIAVEKAWWGNVPRSFYLPGRSVGKVDYVPNETFETDVHFVTYPAAGSDVNSLIVGLGQRLGIGTMSIQSAREADPLIADPDLEGERIVEENLEKALLTSVLQQASDPQGPYQPDDLAYLVKLVVEKKATLFDAIEATHKRAQERQATPAPAGAPETQPGLAPPGMGAEQPTVPDPSAGVMNLSQLLGSLRRPVQVANSMGG